MTRLAIRESVTVADRAERARLARAFVSSVLGLSGWPRKFVGGSGVRADA